MGADRVAGGYTGFMQRYNAYNFSLNGEEAKEEAPEALEAPVSDAAQSAPVTESHTHRADVDIRTIAESFAGRDKDLTDFSLGNEIETLDMRQAISDMQGDQLLREYQYFVGSAARDNASSNVVSNTEDGTVIRLN